MINRFVEPSTFHLKGSSSTVLQIINHRIAEALSFCVLACLAFSFSQGSTLVPNFARRLTELSSMSQYVVSRR